MDDLDLDFGYRCAPSQSGMRGGDSLFGGMWPSEIELMMQAKVTAAAAGTSSSSPVSVPKQDGAGVDGTGVDLIYAPPTLTSNSVEEDLISDFEMLIFPLLYLRPHLSNPSHSSPSRPRSSKFDHHHLDPILLSFIPLSHPGPASVTPAKSPPRTSSSGRRSSSGRVGPLSVSGSPLRPALKPLLEEESHSVSSSSSQACLASFSFLATDGLSWMDGFSAASGHDDDVLLSLADRPGAERTVLLCRAASERVDGHHEHYECQGRMGSPSGSSGGSSSEKSMNGTQEAPFRTVSQPLPDMTPSFFGSEGGRSRVRRLDRTLCCGSWNG